MDEDDQLITNESHEKRSKTDTRREGRRED